MTKRHVVVAITGASGAVYGLGLCRELLAAGAYVTVLLTPTGRQVISHECGLNWHGNEAAIADLLRAHFQASEQNLSFYEEGNFLAPVASGSNPPDAMVICPCSMGTLARVAAGNSGNLIERCADVVLKERRRLILAPRETPLNEIHLENMLKLTRMGAVMVPPMPAFYHGPQSVEDVVNFVIGKILDILGVEHHLFKRWSVADQNIGSRNR